MSAFLPLRLLGNFDGELIVFDPRSDDAPTVTAFDIISHTWNDPVPSYECGIPGVGWQLTINPHKIEEIKILMTKQGVRPYMWVDCLCLNQADANEKSAEIARMYEYYRSANKCHIMVDMPKTWEPQEIIDNLKFIDHVRTNMSSTSLASESHLTANTKSRLTRWEKEVAWIFPQDKSIVGAAGIDMGILNCYSTSIECVQSLFKNFYFS